ncbi:hypothetical protein [Trueperella abortisuis]|uniref:hypothetical protein n=1 Tax=Trueperella abortisuis TaxID=445930 RepID=UPI002892D05C|nr:hypothetical protein [Trueperella abortisuis]
MYSFSRSRRTVRVVGAALGTLALLAGCAASDEGAAPTTQPGNPRDVTQWSPSVVPTSAPVTEDQQEKSRLEQVAQILEIYDLPIPTSESELPPVVRRVNYEDSGPLIAQCLTDNGFAATSVGGTITANAVTDEQTKTYGKVRADCTAKYPVDAKYAQEWSAEQWKVYYEYLVGYYIPCVESFGISIDKDNIPQEQTFIESALSGGDMWSPISEWFDNPDYRDLKNETTPEGAELAEACRQTPPSNKLFG